MICCASSLTLARTFSRSVSPPTSNAIASPKRCANLSGCQRRWAARTAAFTSEAGRSDGNDSTFPFALESSPPAAAAAADIPPGQGISEARSGGCGGPGGFAASSVLAAAAAAGLVLGCPGPAPGRRFDTTGAFPNAATNESHRASSVFRTPRSRAFVAAMLSFVGPAPPPPPSPPPVSYPRPPSSCSPPQAP